MPAVRINLRAGSYVPAFLFAAMPASAPLVQEIPLEQTLASTPAVSRSHAMLPPPMAFWQMAAPTAIALFLAIVAIRFDVRSDDAYSRFWAHLLAHRNSISITLEGSNRTGLISQDLASSALPFSEVAREWQVPIVFGSGASVRAGDDLQIELEMTPQLPKAAITVTSEERPALRIAGPNLSSIQAAVNGLCSRRQFLLSGSFDRRQ